MAERGRRRAAAPGERVTLTRTYPQWIRGTVLVGLGTGLGAGVFFAFVLLIVAGAGRAVDGILPIPDVNPAAGFLAGIVLGCAAAAVVGWFTRPRVRPGDSTRTRRHQVAARYWDGDSDPAPVGDAIPEVVAE